MVNDSNFSKLILEKIDNKENLTDDELRELVKEFFYRERIKKEENSEETSTVIILQGRYFLIDWTYYPGSAVCLDKFNSTFLSQPQEVYLREKKLECWVDKYGRVIY